MTVLSGSLLPSWGQTNSSSLLVLAEPEPADVSLLSSDLNIFQLPPQLSSALILSSREKKSVPSWIYCLLWHKYQGLSMYRAMNVMFWDLRYTFTPQQTNYKLNSNKPTEIHRSVWAGDCRAIITWRKKELGEVRWPLQAAAWYWARGQELSLSYLSGVGCYGALDKVTNPNKH